MDSKNSGDKTPVLQDRAEVDSWQRKFLDFCAGKRIWDILTGAEVVPVVLTEAELLAIPAASRYGAKESREKKIEEFKARSDLAFAVVCKAMEKDNVIYGCGAMDALRRASPRDPAAAYSLVMEMLQPSHVDAQITVETLINVLSMGPNETVPALIQRFAELVNRLPADARPSDVAKMKVLKRAIKKNPTTFNKFKDKLELLMDQEPAVSYSDLCTALMRKHGILIEEENQEAALNTESSQEAKHGTNEAETALFTKGKGSGRGRGRGRGKGMGRGQTDARIGALYSAQGGKGYEEPESNKRPFWRGGGRHNGGKGYDFNNDRGGRGGGKGKGYGKGNSQYKPKFDGTCNKCGHYGHKEIDCYAKRAKY